MKITYDPETDKLTVVLKDVRVSESDEVTPGLILDFDAQGSIVGLEMLEASQRVTDPRHVEFTVGVYSRPRPSSLGIGASGHGDTARRSGDERQHRPER